VAPDGHWRAGDGGDAACDKARDAKRLETLNGLNRFLEKQAKAPPQNYATCSRDGQKSRRHA
jgi:hypothetical protein